MPEGYSLPESVWRPTPARSRFRVSVQNVPRMPGRLWVRTAALPIGYTTIGYTDLCPAQRAG
jgi:hypothetical protein